jgi:SAM-dependent methyltransferase
MAHPAQQAFCETVKRLYPQFFENMDVLDVGSLDVNGNNRYLFTGGQYTGLDLGPGPNVDIVHLAHTYSPGKEYDVVISTECFEHDLYWQESLLNCMRLLKPGGFFLFTCAAPGRAEHGTSTTTDWASPHSHKQFDDYYHNLSAKEVLEVLDPEWFEYMYIETNRYVCDLYFYGRKRC